MTRRDLLIVGLKLLGVFFAAQGLVSFAVGLSSRPTPPLLPTIAYAVISFVFIYCTEWCMKLVDPDQADSRPPDSGAAT